jgi:hypothetical protein
MFSIIKNQDIILIRWWNRSSELHLQSQAPCNNLEKKLSKKKREIIIVKARNLVSKKR